MAAPPPTPITLSRLERLPPELLDRITCELAEVDQDNALTPPSVRQTVANSGNLRSRRQLHTLSRIRWRAAQNVGNFRLASKTVEAWTVAAFQRCFFRRVALYSSVDSINRLVEITDTPSFARAIKELYVCNDGYFEYGSDGALSRSLSSPLAARQARRHRDRTERHLVASLLGSIFTRISPQIEKVLFIEQRLELPVGTELLNWRDLVDDVGSLAYRTDTGRDPEPGIFWSHIFRALAHTGTPLSRNNRSGGDEGVQLSLCYHEASYGIRDIRYAPNRYSGAISTWRAPDQSTKSMLATVTSFNVSIAGDCEETTLSSMVKHMTGLTSLGVAFGRGSADTGTPTLMQTILHSVNIHGLTCFSLVNATIKPGRLSSCLSLLVHLKTLKLEGIRLEERNCQVVGAWRTLLHRLVSVNRQLDHVHLVLLRESGQLISLRPPSHLVHYSAASNCCEPVMLENRLKSYGNRYGLELCLPTKQIIDVALPSYASSYTGHSGAPLHLFVDDLGPDLIHSQGIAQESYPLPARDD